MGTVMASLVRSVSRTAFISQQQSLFARSWYTSTSCRFGLDELIGSTPTVSPSSTQEDIVKQHQATNASVTGASSILLLLVYIRQLDHKDSHVDGQGGLGTLRICDGSRGMIYIGCGLPCTRRGMPYTLRSWSGGDWAKECLRLHGLARSVCP